MSGKANAVSQRFLVWGDAKDVPEVAGGQTTVRNAAQVLAADADDVPPFDVFVLDVASFCRQLQQYELGEQQAIEMRRPGLIATSRRRRQLELDREWRNYRPDWLLNPAKADADVSPGSSAPTCQAQAASALARRLRRTGAILAARRLRLREALLAVLQQVSGGNGQWAVILCPDKGGDEELSLTNFIASVIDASPDLDAVARSAHPTTYLTLSTNGQLSPPVAFNWGKGAVTISGSGKTAAARQTLRPSGRSLSSVTWRLATTQNLRVAAGLENDGTAGADQEENDALANLKLPGETTKAFDARPDWTILAQTARGWPCVIGRLLGKAPVVLLPHWIAAQGGLARFDGHSGSTQATVQIFLRRASLTAPDGRSPRVFGSDRDKITLDVTVQGSQQGQVDVSPVNLLRFLVLWCISRGDGCSLAYSTSDQVKEHVMRHDGKGLKPISHAEALYVTAPGMVTNLRTAITDAAKAVLIGDPAASRHAASPVAPGNLPLVDKCLEDLAPIKRRIPRMAPDVRYGRCRIKDVAFTLEDANALRLCRFKGTAKVLTRPIVDAVMRLYEKH